MDVTHEATQGLCKTNPGVIEIPNRNERLVAKGRGYSLIRNIPRADCVVALTSVVTSLLCLIGAVSNDQNGNMTAVKGEFGCSCIFPRLELSDILYGLPVLVKAHSCSSAPLLLCSRSFDPSPQIIS